MTQFIKTGFQVKNRGFFFFFFASWPLYKVYTSILMLIRAIKRISLVSVRVVSVIAVNTATLENKMYNNLFMFLLCVICFYVYSC